MTMEELAMVIRDATLAIVELDESLAYLDACDKFLPSPDECKTDKQLEALPVISKFHENLRKKMKKRREELNKILKDANDEFHNLYLENQREKEE